MDLILAVIACCIFLQISAALVVDETRYDMAQRRCNKGTRLRDCCAFALRTIGGSGDENGLRSASAHFGSTPPTIDTSINHAFLVIRIPAPVFMRLS